MPNSASGLTKFWAVDRNAKRVGVAMIIALIAGCVFVFFGSSPCAGLLWAGACSAVGWFLGFLFGIPRSLSSDNFRVALPVGAGSSQSTAQIAAAKDAADKAATAKAATDQDAAATDAATKGPADKAAADQSSGTTQSSAAGDSTQGTTNSPWPSTAVNTNLEQISDWLTKIIVGVTLVEIKPAIERLDNAASVIAGSLGTGADYKSFAYALLIYFSTSGFLGSYLLTRLFLQRAFSEANRSESEGGSSVQVDP